MIHILDTNLYPNVYEFTNEYLFIGEMNTGYVENYHVLFS